MIFTPGDRLWENLLKGKSWALLSRREGVFLSARSEAIPGYRFGEGDLAAQREGFRGNGFHIWARTRLFHLRQREATGEVGELRS